MIRLILGPDGQKTTQDRVAGRNLQGGMKRIAEIVNATADESATAETEKKTSIEDRTKRNRK